MPTTLPPRRQPPKRSPLMLFLNACMFCSALLLAILVILQEEAYVSGRLAPAAVETAENR